MPALANRIAPVGLFGLFSLMLFLVPRIAGSLGIKNLCSFVRYLVIWLFGYLVFFVLFVLTSCRAFKVQGSRFKVYAFTFHLSRLASCLGTVLAPCHYPRRKPLDPGSGPGRHCWSLPLFVVPDLSRDPETFSANSPLA